MVSISDALKRVESVYESYEYKGNYSVILKNGDVYEMDSNASDPNGLCMCAGDIDHLPGARDGSRINKQSLPDKTKIAISRVVGPKNITTDFASLGYRDALKEEKFVEKNAGYQGWVKGKPIPIDELDEYVIGADVVDEDLIRQLRDASWDEDRDIKIEKYNDVHWEYINGYINGIEELLEAKGYSIER